MSVYARCAEEDERGKAALARSQEKALDWMHARLAHDPFLVMCTRNDQLGALTFFGDPTLLVQS